MQIFAQMFNLFELLGASFSAKHRRTLLNCFTQFCLILKIQMLAQLFTTLGKLMRL